MTSLPEHNRTLVDTALFVLSTTHLKPPPRFKEPVVVFTLKSTQTQFGDKLKVDFFVQDGPYCLAQAKVLLNSAVDDHLKAAWEHIPLTWGCSQATAGTHLFKNERTRQTQKGITKNALLYCTKILAISGGP